MSHDYKKYKLLRKIVNFFGFKLVEKNFIKNMIETENFAVNVEVFVEKIIKDNQFKKIIQVGSNDGITDDYLKEIIEKYNLNGILLEPAPEPFKKLKINYQKIDNVFLVNKALDKKSSIKSFYTVDKKYLHFYHENISVLSSFDKNHLIKWGVKSNHISLITVECISWEKLFELNNFKDVQIICIDAEGYDHVLVENLLNETQVRPVIIFEWVNIPNKELREILSLLVERDYKFLKFQKDLICYRSDIII